MAALRLTGPADEVLHTLRRHEVPLAIADLADILGLSHGTAASAVDALVRDHLAATVGTTSDGEPTYHPITGGVTPPPVFRGACRHPWIARRLNDWPAYWICNDCGQNFRNAREPRRQPVDPPTVERDGEPTGAI